MAAMAFMTLFLSTACEMQENPVEESPAAINPADVRLSADMDVAEYESLYQKACEAAANSAGKTETISGKFGLDYSNLVTLNVGGAAYIRERSEWLSGASAGSTYIDGATFAALDASASHLVQLRVSDSWFFLRPVQITLLDKGGATANGLFNISTGEFLFLASGASGGSTVGNTSCGFITLGSLYGVVSPDWSRLGSGQYSIGFVAGCTPVLIGASASFYFTGNRVP